MRDTRIFSERISRSYVTQGDPRARNASDLRPGRCSWVTVDDPGLDTKVGTFRQSVGEIRTVAGRLFYEIGAWRPDPLFSPSPTSRISQSRKAAMFGLSELASG